MTIKNYLMAGLLTAGLALGADAQKRNKKDSAAQQELLEQRRQRMLEHRKNQLESINQPTFSKEEAKELTVDDDGFGASQPSDGFGYLGFRHKTGIEDIVIDNNITTYSNGQPLNGRVLHVSNDKKEGSVLDVKFNGKLENIQAGEKFISLDVIDNKGKHNPMSTEIPSEEDVQLLFNYKTDDKGYERTTTDLLEIKVENDMRHVAAVTANNGDSRTGLIDLIDNPKFSIEAPSSSTIRKHAGYQFKTADVKGASLSNNNGYALLVSQLNLSREDRKETTLEAHILEFKDNSYIEKEKTSLTSEFTKNTGVKVLALDDVHNGYVSFLGEKDGVKNTYIAKVEYNPQAKNGQISFQHINDVSTEADHSSIGNFYFNGAEHNAVASTVLNEETNKYELHIASLESNDNLVFATDIEGIGKDIIKNMELRKDHLAIQAGNDVYVLGQQNGQYVMSQLNTNGQDVKSMSVNQNTLYAIVKGQEKEADQVMEFQLLR